MGLRAQNKSRGQPGYRQRPPQCRPALLDHSLSWPGFKMHLLGSLLGFRAASAVQTPATEEARKGVEEGGGSGAGESGSWDK